MASDHSDRTIPSSTPHRCTTSMRPGTEHSAHAKVGDLSFRPPMDLYDFQDRYQIQFDLPGTATDQIEVSIHDAVLSVEARVPARYAEGITPLHAEYTVADYRRQIRLGEDIDRDALAATYVDGVLTLTLPKRAQRTPRRIEVRAG